jgi:phosphoglycerate-specific signal transduction histidine kinase
MGAERTDELEEKVLKLFEEAAALRPGLSIDDSVYDLNYITEKLTSISTGLEKLSDIMMSLSRISLETTRAANSASTALDLANKEGKASPDYVDQPREQRSFWLANQTQTQREATERWQQLQRIVSEVKEAVADRVGTMKRLDSDIRMHRQLLEAKVHAGATSPASYKGQKTPDLSLD